MTRPTLAARAMEQQVTHTSIDQSSPAGAAQVDPATQVVREEQAQRAFSMSVTISAIRCTLTYVVFPFLAPVLGIASGVGSTVGIISSVIGIGANLMSIHRFHSSGHRWRWPISAINVGVIGLLTVLLVLDLGNLT